MGRVGRGSDGHGGGGHAQGLPRRRSAGAGRSPAGRVGTQGSMALAQPRLLGNRANLCTSRGAALGSISNQVATPIYRV